MRSKRRARAVVRPRQIAMYLAKKMTPRSLTEIGRIFGGRDHSTVIHAVRTIEALRAHDSEIDADIRALHQTSWARLKRGLGLVLWRLHPHTSSIGSCAGRRRR